MKRHLIDAYYEYQMRLPALTYRTSCAVRSTMSRIADILWVRYGYDIQFNKSFK